MKYWFPALICLVNEGNGYYLKYEPLFRVVLKSYRNILSVMLYWQNCNIPGVKQRKKLEQKNPAMKCKLWICQTWPIPHWRLIDTMYFSSLQVKVTPHWCYNDEIGFTSFLSRQWLWPLYKTKPKNTAIPHPILSWKILSGIILLKWHLQARPTSLAFWLHN